jgi:hypothetical protein
LKEQSWPSVLKRKNFTEPVENSSSVKVESKVWLGSSIYKKFTGLECTAMNSKQEIHFDKNKL